MNRQLRSEKEDQFVGLLQTLGEGGWVRLSWSDWAKRIQLSYKQVRGLVTSLQSQDRIQVEQCTGGGAHLIRPLKKGRPCPFFDAQFLIMNSEEEKSLSKGKDEKKGRGCPFSQGSMKASEIKFPPKSVKATLSKAAEKPTPARIREVWVACMQEAFPGTFIGEWTGKQWGQAKQFVSWGKEHGLEAFVFGVRNWDKLRGPLEVARGYAPPMRPDLGILLKYADLVVNKYLESLQPQAVVEKKKTTSTFDLMFNDQEPETEFPFEEVKE